MKSPITILIDTAEQHPFSFTSIKADAKDDLQRSSPSPIQVLCCQARSCWPVKDVEVDAE